MKVTLIGGAGHQRSDDAGQQNRSVCWSFVLSQQLLPSLSNTFLFNCHFDARVGSNAFRQLIQVQLLSIESSRDCNHGTLLEGFHYYIKGKRKVAQSIVMSSFMISPSSTVA